MEGKHQNQEIVIGGTYRHYKDKLYKVLHIALHSEELKPYVVYQALYGDFGIWIRPMSMFLETVNLNGFNVPRFELLTSS